MRNNIFFISLFILSITDIYSQSFEWIKKSGGTHSDYAKCIQTDNTGNIYVAGKFTDTAEFDGHFLFSDTFSGSDAYLAKYSSNGDFIWVKKIMETFNTFFYDQKGHLYFSGSFTGTLPFYPLSNDTFRAVTGDSYIAKIDTAGNFIWAKHIGGDKGYEQIQSLVTDSLDNIYITGSITDSAQFGSFTLNSVPHKSEMFVAKYDFIGNCVWAKQAGSNNNARGWDLAINNYGDIFATGYFVGAAFDTLESEINDANQSSQDIFITKYDNNGNLKWVKHGGGKGEDEGRKIVTDKHGNCYVTGIIHGNSTFDTKSCNGGLEGYFLAKYEADGLILWLSGGASSGGVFIGDLSVDNGNNSFLSGVYAVDLLIGSNSYSVSGPSWGRKDMFLIQYNDAGYFGWLKQSTSMANYSQTVTYSIDLNNEGYVVIAGGFYGEVWFDNLVLNSFVSASGETDIFIAKINYNNVAILEDNDEKIFSIYPNPTGNLINIRCLSMNCKQLLLSVKNQLGQTVYSVSESNIGSEYKKIIDLSQQNKGIYFIEIIADEKRMVKKVVLQ